jgi:Cft2 family RNA processing exonuclease
MVTKLLNNFRKDLLNRIHLVNYILLLSILIINSAYISVEQ